MKIERKDKQITIHFREIEEGTVFISGEGDICMKTDYIKNDDDYEEYNAVILETGELTFFKEHEFVTLPTSANLVIE